MRTYELAKELNITTKELIKFMSKQNIEKKTMSAFTDTEIKNLKSYLQNNFSNYKSKKDTKGESNIDNQFNNKKKYPSEDKEKDINEEKNINSDKLNQKKENKISDKQEYQGNRTSGERTGYQGNRTSGERTGYQGNRTSGERTGYQGNRTSGERTGYQGNRTSGERTGYQGNRTSGERTGYQGNRTSGERTGYQGNRTSGERTGYQGNRTSGERTGYQGNRASGERTGYQGNRASGERTGYQGNRTSGGYGKDIYDKDKDLDKDKKTATKSSSSKNTPVIEGAKPAVANRRFTNKPKQNLFSKNTKKKGGNDEAQITATQRKKDKRKIKKRKEEEELLAAQAAAKAAENDIKTIKIAGSITVGELANKLGKGIQEIISPLMKIGIMASINQEIDFYTAAKIAEEFDILVEPLEQINILEEAFGKIEDKEEDLKPRPPVVVVMGHVDHGKTSLLDAIRKSHVADGEAGGITQRIGAYQVDINEKTITFLDTPGHEAFTAMRMRGAQVTDIAILVVAADDGVMPQTVEAINHAKAAEVEIIVAINKIDKDGANMDRVKQELSEHGIVPEDWGGSVVCVPVSAKKRIGIDDLLEATLLVSELKELKANPNKRAMGTVIEANLDKGKGPVATVLVQEGSLTISEPIVIGATHGRVRAMIDHKGNRVKKVGPSTPVEIVGLGSVPKAGDILYVANSEKQAAQVASSMVEQTREEMIKQRAKISLDDLFNQIKDGKIKELNLIIKADVQGSVEAVRNSLERLSNEEVKIRIVHSGAGQVTESDIMLASTSSAIIIAFNVNYDATAKQIADEQKVDVRLYSVIYNAIEDISNAMKGMLDPIFEEKIIGHAEIRQLFKASGTAIAGSYVTDGKISRNSKVRLLRNGKIVHDGELLALKRFKDDVKEVATGYECGISFNKYNDLLEGDIVEAYVMEEVTR